MDSTKVVVKQSGEEELPYIPEDVIFEHILHRLPVKPLGQLMLVKKSWYACIRSSRFVRKHFDFSVSYIDEPVFVDDCEFVDDGDYDDGEYLLHTCFWSKDQETCGQLYADGPDGYQKVLDVKLPKVPGRDENSFLVVGSTDGLVCLSDDFINRYGRRVYFWNPLNGKIRANSDSTCEDLSCEANWIALGFWFDSEEIDHKLLRLIYIHKGEPGAYFCYCHVEVYSFRTNSWRKFGDGVINPFICSWAGGVFAKGYLYWIATYVGEDGLQDMILSCDVKNEVFRAMEWPFDPTAMLMNYMGSLAVYLKLWSWDMRLIKGGALRILIENDGAGAWKRIFKVKTEEKINFALGCVNNGRILLQTEDMRIVEYEPYDQSTRVIAVCEYEYFNQMSAYSESLLLLDEEIDGSAELDGDTAKENELKKETFKDPGEQATINNS